MNKELKEQINTIVSDDTNRLYIRTEKYPEGELIMYKEVDDFIDSIIDKTVQSVVLEIQSRMPSHDAVQEYLSLITNNSDSNK